VNDELELLGQKLSRELAADLQILAGCVGINSDPVS
jgi:hypothetical protein